MEEFARFVMDGLDALVDALFHMAFWKLGAGLVLGTLLALFVSALPEEYRGSARAVALVAVGLAALVTVFAPIDWTDVLG
jgi:hypothetical protein